MKLVKFFMVLVVLALPLAFVNAQEDEEVVEAVLWSGSYVLTAESGSFVEADEDDTFTLTLSDVSDNANWIVNLPDLASGFLSTLDLIAYWTFQPELTATALVTTENESILVTLSLINDEAYDVDAETLTFLATVSSITPFDPEVDASKVELPEEFEVVTLFINMDVEFAEGIAAGAVARSEGTRNTGTSAACTPTPIKKCP
jgi:hypothetical protein